MLYAAALMAGNQSSTSCVQANGERKNVYSIELYTVVSEKWAHK